MNNYDEKRGELLSKENSFNTPSKEDVQSRIYYEDIVLENISLKNDSSIYSVKKSEIFQDGIILDNKKYSEKIDRILRLAFFYQWSKEDPLLYSSTLDIEKFSRSISKLEEVSKKMESKFKLDDDIFPIAFLQNFIESSKAYKKFNYEISEENAAELVEKIEEVNRSYYENISLLERSLKNLKLEKNNINYTYLDGETTTSLDLVLGDIKKIKENSIIVKKLILDRKKCLYNSQNFCQRPLEKIVMPKLEDKQVILPYFLNKDEFSFDEKVHGPYKINSSCWGKRDEQYLYVTKKCSNNKNYCIENFFSATDLYFKKINPDILLTSQQTSEYLAKKDVEIMLQYATNPYTCANLEYQPKIAIVNYFHTKLVSENHYYSNIKKQKNYQNFSIEFQNIVEFGEIAEESFLNEQYPSEDKLEYLSDFYAYTYSYVIKNRIKNINLDDLLNRRLMIEEKMIDLSSILNVITYYLNEFTIRYNLDDIEENDMTLKSYIYFARGDYSLTYLNFSSVIWRSERNLQYLGKDKIDINKNSVYLFDRKMVIEEYGVEKYLNWMKILKNIRMLQNEKILNIFN